jgi:hypothetical protein
MSGVRRVGDEAIVVQQRQGKTCMVKARLLAPQSARLTVKPRCRIAETSYREEYGHCPLDRLIWRLYFKASRHPAYPASLSMRWGNRTNRAPNHVASLLHRQCGIAYTGDHKTAPAWRRSPHSTQGWPVMGAAGGQRRPHWHGDKWGVTTHESPSVRGRGTAFRALQHLRTRGCADATRYSK